MVIGKCTACAARDAHIADLKSQLEQLQKLLFPQRPTQDILMADLEADAILSGSQEPINAEVSDINREADRFLTGNHDSEFEGEL